MKRLSLALDQMQSYYSVVVVGSGYGGAIAASRLARAGQSVCLLERGREFLPGEYPDTEAEALGEMQVDLPAVPPLCRTGLYDFRVNDDINVFVGCGLGGTSLVNANVSLRSEAGVFADPRWPAQIRRDSTTDESRCVNVVAGAGSVKSSAGTYTACTDVMAPVVVEAIRS